MHHIDSTAKRHPPKILDLAPLKELAVSKWPTGAFNLEGSLDLFPEEDDFWVVDGGSGGFETGQDFCGSRVVAFLDEVARGFWEGEHLEDKADGEEGLEGDWEAPLDGSLCEGEAKVKPVGYAEPDDGDCSLHTEEDASVAGFAHLGLVHGDG